MDSIKPTVESLRPVESYNDLFSTKNGIIILLCILLLLSFLGINLLNISGNIIQTIVNIFGPLVSQILSILGYTTGSLLNITADVASDTAKTGIDIAEGSIQSVGNILRDASQANVNEQSKASLDTALNKAANLSPPPPVPKPDSTENPIQNPITTNKAGWCLVGEYKGRRGCIEVTEQDKCLSGQVYPSQKMCLNPVLTPNVPYRPIPPQPPVYESGAFFTGMYPPQPMPPPPQ
jgi:hypothetical protein